MVPHGLPRASVCVRGDNEGMTGRSLVARVAIVGALVIGLVGMHHLVIAACHHIGAPEVSGVAAMTHDLTMQSPMTGHDHRTAPVGPDHQAPMPHGAVGAAAMCLAVLLLFALVLAPKAWGHLRRTAERPRRRLLARAIAAVARPPDLHLLAVSRT